MAAPALHTARAALLCATVIWGASFVIVQRGLRDLPVFHLLAIRFAIASLTLILLAPRALGRLTRESRRQAVVLGCLYGGAQILQTAGLAETPASVSGFIAPTSVFARAAASFTMAQASMNPG